MATFSSTRVHQWRDVMVMWLDMRGGTKPLYGLFFNLRAPKDDMGNAAGVGPNAPASGVGEQCAHAIPRITDGTTNCSRGASGRAGTSGPC
jgi:hypothetical protein